MTGYLTIILLAVLLALSLPFATLAGDGHEHEESGEVREDEDHADELDDDHEDHADELDDDYEGQVDELDHDHSDHDDAGLIELSPEAMRLARIELSRAERGRISKTIAIPGEVGFNEDRLVHVAPRFAGVAKEARRRVGDYVNAGDVIAVIESNESLTPYTIEATISGWIIERHLMPGEFISEEHTIYVIADLSDVWVNLAVHPRDADQIAVGQRVSLKAVGCESCTGGTISYVSPVLDVRTRSITARVVLPNRNNSWRPGTFVQAQISTELPEEYLIVKREAVQILDDEHVVFVTEGEGLFRSVPVTIGEGDSEHTRVLSGLEEGVQYVAAGAFELKAKVVTSSLGEHAGHGH